MNIITELLSDHWSFITVSLLLALIGQLTKGLIFTKDRIAKYYVASFSEHRVHWLINKSLWWGRKTLPIHPAAAGFCLGFIPGMPVPSMIGTSIAACLYYCLAGILSAWMFDIVKSALKKQGVVIQGVD